MRIGIEAQRIFRKKKHGMDIYALELIRHLQVMDQINEYFIFIRPGEDPCLQESDNFKIIEVKGLTYADWEQVQLPRMASRYNLDLLHCTSNTAPLFSPAPLHLTLHDIIYLNQEFSGGSWYQKLGHYYRKWIVPLVFEKAKKVYTVSNFEKGQIKKHFGASEKVEVVYNGVSEMFQPQSKASIKSARIEYNLPEQYIFFLGNTVPKKNLTGMLQAYDIYSNSEQNPIDLVMAESTESELDHMLKKLKLEHLKQHIHLTGYVKQADLPAIYSGAEVFVYPSLRESFGIPIIEAMACGTTVITSDTSSMPEVGGQAAFFINPYKPESIASQLSEFLNSFKYFKKFSAAESIEHAQKFDWESTSRKMTNHYFNRQVEYVNVRKVVSTS